MNKPTKIIQLHAFAHADGPLLIGPVLTVNEDITSIVVPSERLEWTPDNQPQPQPIQLVFIEASIQLESGAWVFELSLNETVRLYTASKNKVTVPKRKVFLS